MVAGVGEQEAVVGHMDNQAQIAAGPDRPEMGVAGPFDPVEFHTRRGGIHLQVESRGFNGLLFRPGQAGEGGGEGRGDAEFQ